MNCYHLLWIPSFSEWMVLKYIPPWLRSHLICGLLFIYFLFICSAKIYQEHIMCQHFTFRKWWEERKKKKRKRKKKRKKIPSAPWNLHSLQSKSHSLLSFSLLFALSPTSVSKLFGTILLRPHPKCVKPPCLAPTRFTPYRICSWVHVQYRQTLQCLLMA